MFLFIRSQKHATLLGALFITVLVLLFQNCSQDGISSLMIDSVNCDTPNMKTNSQKTELLNRCDDAKNYLCDKRVFSPDKKTEQTRETLCTDTDGFGNVCFDMRQFVYNTSELAERENATADDFNPGGSYNHDEFTCINSRMDFPADFTPSGEGRTLAEALLFAHARCREALL